MKITIPNSVEEEKVIIDAAKKDHRFFAPLYEKYFNRIFRFILKRTGDEQLCADITSQVFLKALIKLKQYRHQGYPFSAWLYRIAINEVNMYYRKANKTITVEVQEKDVTVLMLEIDVSDPTDVLIDRALLELTKLDPDQQQLIELRFFEKQSFKEIGELLRISEGNAKIRTYRVLDKLKEALGKNEAV